MIKSIYRNWVRTLLSVVLFVAIFLLMNTQAGEYLRAVEEFETAVDAYYGTGTVERTTLQYWGPDFPDYIKADERVAGQAFITKRLPENYCHQTMPYTQIEAITDMDYVDSVDARVMTAGISVEYCRLDDGESYYNYTHRCVIEGTFAGLKKGDPALLDDGKKGMNEIVLENCVLAAGTAPWEVGEKQISIYCVPLRYDQAMISAIGGTQKRLTVRYDESYVYDSAYMEQLREGERYAFVVCYEPLMEETYYLADMLTTWAYEPVCNVEGVADWKTASDFAELAELMQIIEMDRHTFDMVYTEDMTLIPKFAEGKMAIEEGRNLSKADSDAAARVCVISHELAEAYGLGVGDMLTFDLGNELFEQYKGLGAQAVLPQRVSTSRTSVGLEIVGIYADLDSNYIQVQKPNWYYSVNTIFLPKSIIQETGAQLDGHCYSPAEFSFRVSAEHIRSFEEETRPKIESLGYSVHVDDHGWLELEQNFQQTKKTMTITLCLYCVAVVVAIILGIYLHISREKKNYAIMRALGTPRKLAFRHLLAPFLLIFGTCTAVAAGISLFGKPMTVKVLVVVLVCALLELAAALAGALTMLWRIERKPLLLLLQEGRNGK